MLVNHCVYTCVHMLKVSLRNLQTARKPPENARRFLPACKEDRICIDKQKIVYHTTKRYLSQYPAASGDPFCMYFMFTPLYLKVLNTYRCVAIGIRKW